MTAAPVVDPNAAPADGYIDPTTGQWVVTAAQEAVTDPASEQMAVEGKIVTLSRNGRFVFVVYSASYGWGFNTGSNPQLFMFGLDLDKAKMGVDPSYQPVWLPFQDPSTGNHSAIWTTD